MSLVNIKIEGIPYQVESGLTILEAAKQCGYDIPTLCAFNHGKCSRASCRVCLVSVKGARGLVASCVYPVNEGMEISISDQNAVQARRVNVELILSNHNKDCQQCNKNDACELLRVAKIVGARENMFVGEKTPTTYDDLSNGLIRDTSKCILCGRCIEKCKDAQGIGILGFENRGFKTIVAPAYNASFKDVACIQCGQCVSVCPTGALMEKGEIDLVDQAFRQGKKVVVQTAPAVRAALGEEFGLPIGTPVTGKMVSALKRLGFYRVYDTNFGADLTIWEEASELLQRIQNGGALPMITSCSPGWVNYAEHYYGKSILPHLSSCKSPHEMEGAIIKSYMAKEHGLDPKDIFVVSIMPCTAKKGEKERDANANDGMKNVDAVLTTRELATLIKRSGIQFNRLPDSEFDQDLLGEYSGAGVIFGVTGGVMEAAVRTAYYWLTGKECDDLLHFETIRALDGVKEATLDINGTKLNIAAVSSMKSAKPILEDIKNGTSKYHFVEIMGCPGGCINGGGQPFVRSCFLPNESLDIEDTYREKRAKALYSEDERQTIRRSHLNTQVKALYDNYLGEIGGHLAHELLHTTYTNKEKEL